jgi:hypothetical protein
MNIARGVFCLALTGSLMGCATAPPAHRGRGWEFLGRRQVDFRVDHDVIEVGRMEGRFNELRFVVHGGAIEMYDVVVVLGDGETVRPNTRLIFDRGEGREIDLPGERRVVRRVEFVYRSLRSDYRRATVSLFGR